MIAGGYVSQEKKNKIWGGHFREQNALLQAFCSSKHPPLAQENFS
jgi:hypothetical protein